MLYHKMRRHSSVYVIENVDVNSVKPDEVSNEVFDIPDGNPPFFLAPLKGKTEPVLTFLDSGCSDAVFEHDIPGNQL